MKITTELLAELEAKAKAATTDPWTIERGAYSGKDWLIGSVYLGSDRNGVDHWIHITTDRVHASEMSGDAGADAEFIAALHPGVALALIEHVRKLEALAAPVQAAPSGAGEAGEQR